MKIKELWHRLKSFPLIGKPYEALIGKRKTRRFFEAQREELLTRGSEYLTFMEELLSGSGCEFFADAGTLLGIVRDGKLISWDMDIDYGIMVTDDHTWENLERYMNEKGLRKTREFVFRDQITEQSYRYDKMVIDIVGHFPMGDGAVVRFYKRVDGTVYRQHNEMSAYRYETPLLTETKVVEMQDGTKVHVPVNADGYLSAVYNETWATPDPTWNETKSKYRVLEEDTAFYRLFE